MGVAEYFYLAILVVPCLVIFLDDDNIARKKSA